MNSRFFFGIQWAWILGVVFGVLFPGLISSRAQSFTTPGGIGFTLDASGYTNFAGQTISGTISIEVVNDGVNDYSLDYDAPWYGSTINTYDYDGYIVHYCAPWYVYDNGNSPASTTVELVDGNNNVIAQEIAVIATTGSTNFLLNPMITSAGPDIFGKVNVSNTDPNFDNDYYGPNYSLTYPFPVCDPDNLYSYGQPPTTANLTIYNQYTTINVAVNGYLQLTESVMPQESFFTISRTDNYNNRIVYYTVSGTAIDGSDYTASFSDSVAFTAGGAFSTNIAVSTLNNIDYSKTVVLTITTNASEGNPYQGVGNNATITFLPNDASDENDAQDDDLADMFGAQVFQPAISAFNPVNVGNEKNGMGSTTSSNAVVNTPYAFLNVQAVSPYATGLGPTPGVFTITRSGGTNVFTLNYTITGTATAGSSYMALPSSIQFAANQTSTNLSINVLTNTPLTAAQTVVLTLTSGTNYFLGYNPQAVVTLLPNSSLTNSVASAAGRYWRGSGSDPTYWSQVIPMDYQSGTVYSNLNGNCSTLYPGLISWIAQTNYHYNAANSSPQTNVANRIAFNNPLVAFGERTGGTPLYFSQPYNFGIYAGDPLLTTTQIVVQVYNRSNDQLAGTIKIAPPNYFNTNSMVNYATNGFQLTTNAFGLTTTLSDSPTLNWGTTSLGAYVLTHTASSSATNYYYLVEACGYPAAGSNAMAITTNGAVTPSLLYTLEFEARPPWRSVFLDQPQFTGNPMPPIYAGKTVAEMLTNTPPVTNVVNFLPSNATNLDDSPELRRHPTLDNFVASMGNDPIALANYVINSIDLTDPLDYSDNGNIAEQSIDPGGVSRGALGTFMEKQGSAADQCALLVYLLRQAGVPAVYEFAPRNGLQIMDARLSQMLKFQIQGAVSEAGQLYTTNTMIPVNYPWVAAYIGTNWVHIFPWMKDYEITEGFNLYDYMPTNYSSAYPWVRDYIYGKTNLLAFTTNGDNTPGVIFPAFLGQTLLQNHPGVSVDDIGVQILNRQHYYARWQDFPTPTWLTNVSTPLESLTASGITNISPTLTNIFDMLSVQVYSVNNPTNNIQTGNLRLVDLHNREFYISQVINTNNTNLVQLSLILMPFRTNMTHQYAFSNDSTNLSKEVLTMNLGTNESQLGVRFSYQRHQALGSGYAIDPSIAFLGLSAIEQINFERPLLKGDQAAICLDYGRVTQDMLNVHAQDLWQMESSLQANPSLTNSVSPDVYEGATMYLAGMSYYKKISDFNQVNENLNKVNILSTWAAGLSKISAARDGFGTLTNGLDPVLPNLDMFFYEAAYVGNGTVQPDSGVPSQLAQQNFNLLSIINNSAEEHQTIDRFYQQTNAVSTVRLLQLAQSSGAGIVPLNFNNYVAQGQVTNQGQSLKNWDVGMWGQIASALQNSPYTIAYITPGPMTNSAYAGMGALILGWNQWEALITPESLNGAFGQLFPPGTISADNSANFVLNDTSDFTVALNLAIAGTDLAAPVTSVANVPSEANEIKIQVVGLSQFQDTQLQLAGSIMNDAFGGNQSQIYGDIFADLPQFGYMGGPDNSGGDLFDKLLDPVHCVTGEFYVDETDLQLAGPMPLALRRNYSSQNLADNQFGMGWKLNIMPYLAVATGGTNIYAAEMDGAVLAYVQTNASVNIWVPTTAANPQLDNNSIAGMGGLANRMRNYLVQTNVNSITNYTLYGSDGSIRVFQVESFNNGSLIQTRPYLQTWTDSRGNYFTFSYGTNSTQPNFGQMIRIQASNGNYLGFDYDFNGHIIDAYSGDGRRLTYEFDQYGDLINVTLPDDTTRSYTYQHATQTLTNGILAAYSTHLIIEEDKPDGRALQNVYDSQRRVTNQLSTAGNSLTPIRTGTFVYANNFVLTNSFTNFISGYTLVIDGNGHTNRYDYTNSLITKVTDPLGQTIQQIWFTNNVTAPGYYPRSVAILIDKRGLTNQFQYDSNGDVTNTINTGDLTGDGITTQTATNTAVYTTNCLPKQVTDAVGNSKVIVYDPVFNYQPQQTILYAGSVPVSTNYTIYGNATNVVVNGNVTQTNIALGLPVRQIRAINSPDAATNDVIYNGNGFPIETIRYSGTADPNVTNTFFFNERGEMVTQVDALGAETFYDYDALNRPTVQENYDEFGNLLSWNYLYYDDNGELNWIDGPRYNPEDYIFYDYDGDGRRSTEIHWRSQANPNGGGVQAPAGYNQYAQSFYEYDPMGDLLLAVDPRGAMTTNTWDALCRLVKRTHLDTNGVTVLSTEGFGYEPGGLVKYYTNALGGLTTNQYSWAGKLETRSNPDGSTNGWRYARDGRIKKEIQSNGAYWQTTYDDVNRITTRIFVSATGVAEATNSVQLDRRGNVIQRVDAGGNAFTTAFDGLDRPKVVAGPTIATVNESSGFSPGGPDTYTTNLLQQVVTNYFDVAGRTLTNANALGEYTVTKRDAIGRTTSVQTYSPAKSLVRERYFAYSADHNSVTVTEGSGANAISHTTWTDPQGHPLLAIANPSTGASEFTLNQYDLAENLVSVQHDTITGGAFTNWTTTSLVYDGLNRVIQKNDRDNAITTYAYDGLNDLTNRIMPGSNLVWSAVYTNSGQLLKEWNQSGTSGTRTNTYAYFGSGSPFAGLLQSKTDARGVICAYTYDDQYRVTTNAYTGSLPEQKMTTVFQYEPRNLVTNITETFAANTTGTNTSITRTFDAYGQLSQEAVNGGTISYGASQYWDATGRRTQLNYPGNNYGFGWQAAGSLISASDTTIGEATGSGTYGYSTAGLLNTRTVNNRVTSITARDGEGRPLAITNSVNLLPELSETLAWSADGLLTAHTVTEIGNFTDTRAYSYANQSRRLTQEQLNLNATATWTGTFAYDNGVPAGPGVLTSSGQGSALWNGLSGSFARVAASTNTLISYAAYGHVNGQSTLSAWLDGQPMAILGIGTNAMEWRSTMELAHGNHQLLVAALHPSGMFTAWATNTFTNSLAFQATTDSYDSAGNITNRVWKNPSGTVVERTQILSWDARGRLHAVTERDSKTNGYNWTATYDGLNRRLSTTSILVTNGVAFTSTPTTINSYFDPQVEFLELGVTYGNTTEWKLYGPDLNGRYGGLNGTGGFEGVSPYLNLFEPTIADFRGNILGVVTNSGVAWNLSRPTGFGAVPDYRPMPLANGANIAQASAWRGRWADITGYNQIGLRPYDPVSGRWLTFDSVPNELDPNYYSFCGGDPINGFDPDGRCLQGAGTAVNAMILGTANLIYNAAGAAEYALASPFAPNWAYQNLGGYAQNFANQVTGSAQFGYNVAATATYGAISPFAPDFAYNTYGGNVQQLMGQAPALYGGNNQSTAYQIGYAGVGIVGLIMGTEEAEVGELGTVSQASTDGNVITDPARLLPAPPQPVALLPENAASLTSGTTVTETTIANPVPTTLARVIPNGINATTLGGPGAVDVFVADASQLVGLNAQQIAAKLGIPESPTGFQVIQFPTPQSGLGSPVFRSNPGFIGGGQTSGGASEFVIPNGPIPPGATITIVH